VKFTGVSECLESIFGLIYNNIKNGYQHYVIGFSYKLAIEKIF